MSWSRCSGCVDVAAQQRADRSHSSDAQYRRYTTSAFALKAFEQCLRSVIRTGQGPRPRDRQRSFGSSDWGISHAFFGRLFFCACCEAESNDATLEWTSNSHPFVPRSLPLNIKIRAPRVPGLRAMRRFLQSAFKTELFVLSRNGWRIGV